MASASTVINVSPRTTYDGKDEEHTAKSAKEQLRMPTPLRDIPSTVVETDNEDVSSQVDSTSDSDSDVEDVNTSPELEIQKCLAMVSEIDKELKEDHALTIAAGATRNNKPMSKKKTDSFRGLLKDINVDLSSHGSASGVIEAVSAWDGKSRKSKVVTESKSSPFAPCTRPGSSSGPESMEPQPSEKVSAGAGHAKRRHPMKGPPKRLARIVVTNEGPSSRGSIGEEQRDRPRSVSIRCSSRASMCSVGSHCSVGGENMQGCKTVNGYGRIPSSGSLPGVVSPPLEHLSPPGSVVSRCSFRSVDSNCALLTPASVSSPRSVGLRSPASVTSPRSLASVGSTSALLGPSSTSPRERISESRRSTGPCAIRAPSPAIKAKGAPSPHTEGESPRQRRSQRVSLKPLVHHKVSPRVSRSSTESASAQTLADTARSHMSVSTTDSWSTAATPLAEKRFTSTTRVPYPKQSSSILNESEDRLCRTFS